MATTAKNKKTGRYHAPPNPPRSIDVVPHSQPIMPLKGYVTIGRGHYRPVAKRQNLCVVPGYRFNRVIVETTIRHILDPEFLRQFTDIGFVQVNPNAPYIELYPPKPAIIAAQLRAAGFNCVIR